MHVAACDLTLGTSFTGPWAQFGCVFRRFERLARCLKLLKLLKLRYWFPRIEDKIQNNKLRLGLAAMPCK